MGRLKLKRSVEPLSPPTDDAGKATGDGNSSGVKNYDPKGGFALALVASLCWGVLPIGLKLALADFDPYTITFFRFSIAALLLSLFMGRKVQLDWKRQRWFYLGAAVALTLNYVFFVIGLHHSTPANSQLFIQLSPMLFGLLSVILFKESFIRYQGVGVLLLLTGLSLFYSDQVKNLGEVLTHYSYGCFMLLLAGLAWALYALGQKKLGQTTSATLVVTVVLILCSIMTAPLADFSSVWEARSLSLWALLFCGLNTMVAYAAFAGAVARWEASRVSAVLPLTPIWTLLAMPSAHQWFPDYLIPERLNTAGILGALFVIIGSAMVAKVGRS